MAACLRLPAITNMSPGISSHHHPSRVLGNFKMIGKGVGGVFAGRVETPHLKNIFAGQSRRAIATTSGGASLLCGVLSVGQVCPKKKMIGAHTRRRVAGMADQKTFGYRPEVQLPRDPVCKPALPSEVSISVLVTATRPKPATASNLDLPPKPKPSVTFALGRAKLQSRPSNVGRTTIDGTITSSTVNQHRKSFLSDVNGVAGVNQRLQPQGYQP